MTPLPKEISDAIPPKWLVYVMAIWVLSQSVGRFIQAIRGGGGLVGIWNGLMYGTNENTPEQIQAIENIKAKKVS